MLDRGGDRRIGNLSSPGRKAAVTVGSAVATEDEKRRGRRVSIAVTLGFVSLILVLRPVLGFFFCSTILLFLFELV
jgi:hypothetical protein